MNGVRPRSRWLRVLVLLALGTFAVVSLGRGISNGLQPGTGSQDLAPVYRASKLWVSRQNPYATMTDEQWSVATGSSEVPPVIVMAGYSTPYPPIALLNLSWLSVFEWHHARIAWLVFNVLLSIYLGFAILWLWPGRWGRFGAAALFLFWHCGIGVRVGLGVGQHQLLVFACIVTALILRRRGDWLLSGVFLALSLHKFTWTAFVVPYVLVKRDLKVIASMAVSSVALVAIFLVWPHASAAAIVSAYARELAWWAGRSEGGGLPGMGTTHVFPLLRLLFPASVAPVVVVALAAAGLFATCYLVAGIPKARGDLLGLEAAAFLTLSLWATYHGLPDTVVLVLPLLAALAAAGENGGKSGAAAPFAIVLAWMWVVDPTKIASIAGRATDDLVIRMVDGGYRLGVLLAFGMVLAQLARERCPFRAGLAPLG